MDERLALALDHHRAGRLVEAGDLYEEVLREDPSREEALHLLGVLAYQAGDYDRALDCSQRVLVLNPRHAGACQNIGNVRLGQGRLVEARRSYEKALQHCPDDPQINLGFGNLLYWLGYEQAAIDAYQQAIALDPEFAEAYYNLGNLYQKREMLAEAIACYRRTVALRPEYTDAWNNLGVALRYGRQHLEALVAYKRLVALQPDAADAYWNIALILLLTGNFPEGWRFYEWRWQQPDFADRRRVFSGPLWKGESLEGRTVLLYAEQGLGDAIQFVRYASLVKQMGARIVVECQPSLKVLFRLMKAVDEVIVRSDPLPDFDFHCPLLSLPFIFQTTLETIPGATPYLMPDAGAVRVWRDRLASDHAKLKVGLAWQGIHPRHKSVPLHDFASLLSLGGISFYSLQKGEGAGQVQDLPGDVRLFDHTGELSDFAETAGLVMNLDLVITVDTAVAHLAGALGRPVWTLLPYSPDWRWMLDREDSPWYPTMRLFRQESRGAWGPVLDRVLRELGAWVDGRG